MSETIIIKTNLKNRVNDIAYTKEGTDGQKLRSSKWIVIVIMIFENLLTLQFFKVHFVMVDIMLGRHICLS